MGNLFTWKLHGDGKTLAPGEVVEPDERLTWTRTIGIGAQHVIAMFGATFLVPILTHFDPSTRSPFESNGRWNSRHGSTRTSQRPVDSSNTGRAVCSQRTRDDVRPVAGSRRE